MIGPIRSAQPATVSRRRTSARVQLRQLQVTRGLLEGAVMRSRPARPTEE